MYIALYEKTLRPLNTHTHTHAVVSLAIPVPRQPSQSHSQVSIPWVLKDMEELVPSTYQLWTISADGYLTYPLPAILLISINQVYLSILPIGSPSTRIPTHCNTSHHWFSMLDQVPARLGITLQIAIQRKIRNTEFFYIDDWSSVLRTPTPKPTHGLGFRGRVLARLHSWPW
jgi:hypothetical protein